MSKCPHEKFEALCSRFDLDHTKKIGFDEFLTGIKLASLNNICSTGESCQANLRAWLMFLLSEANTNINAYLDEIFAFCHMRHWTFNSF